MNTFGKGIGKEKGESYLLKKKNPEINRRKKDAKTRKYCYHEWRGRSRGKNRKPKERSRT